MAILHLLNSAIETGSHHFLRGSVSDRGVVVRMRLGD